MSYKLNNWDVSTIKYLTPQPETAPEAGREYFTFDVLDLSETPVSNLTNKTEVAPSNVGNSLETVAIFDNHNTNVYFTLYIDDGTNRAGITVKSGYITTLDDEYTIAVENTDKNLHRYTLTLQNGLLNVFFDTTKVFAYKITENSTETGLGLGFFETQSGAATLNVKYLKQAKGVYNYIKLENVDFELQIDSEPTFDSVNLHTYTKSSFSLVPATPKAWDPVSLICGTNTDTGYDFLGLVQAASIQLPVRSYVDNYVLYYRVRFKSQDYISEWSSNYLTKRKETIDLTIEESGDGTDDLYKIAYQIHDTSNQYFAFNPTEDGLGIQLPETPTTDGLTFTIYNASYNSLNVFTYDFIKPFSIDGLSIVRLTYDLTSDKWYKSIVSKQKSFVLPQNIQNLVFNVVYKSHIPALDYVYNKQFNSGNVADLVLADSTAIDYVFNQLTIDRTKLDAFSAERDSFNERWSNVFGLDASLFKNSAEMRDCMLCLNSSLPGQMLEKPIEELIYELTGAKPRITEYKDKMFNVLCSDEQQKTLPTTEKFYLYDENNPSFFQKPFVLYGGSAKAFTWQIDVFDPYNLQYNQDMIKKIIDMYKPAHTYVIVNFYNYEGVSYTKHYYYGTDNYLESLYNL